MVDKTATLMTAAEFEALPESQHPTELIEGKLVVRGVPKVNHQRVAGNIYAKLRDLIPNGEGFIPPISVKFDDATYYQPDVIWVAENSASEISEDGFNGPLDLVVEVLSPGTAKTDRVVKFQTYQKYAVVNTGLSNLNWLFWKCGLCKREPLLSRAYTQQMKALTLPYLEKA